MEIGLRVTSFCVPLDYGDGSLIDASHERKWERLAAYSLIEASACCVTWYILIL